MMGGSNRRRVVSAVAALALLSACQRNEATLVGDDGTRTTPEVGADGAPPNFAVGDRVGLGDLEFVVHEVTDPFDNGDRFGMPAPDHRWVAVDLEVFNVGAEPQGVSPAVCFDVQDQLNRSYGQEIFLETSVARPGGEVAPGASRRGTVVWEVPDGVEGLRMNVKCQPFSTGSATFQLT